MIGKIKRICLSCIRKLTAYRRRCFLRRERKRLKNVNPSIITSNCIGGIVYHDLNLKFMSPTINLFFDSEEYITFLENLEGFLKEPPVEIKKDGIDYPVGELRCGDKKIAVHFMHYKSFREALDKWEERKKRIQFSNLFIVWEVADEKGPEKELLDRFLNLKYPNKVLITGKGCPIEGKEVFKIDLYGKGYYNAKILAYKNHLLSCKRILNQFDFVKFLNNGKT